MFILVAAAGVAAAGLAAHAASVHPPMLSAASGKAGSAGVSSPLTRVKTDDKTYAYCIKVMDDMKRGKTYGGKGSDGLAASDCVGLFATPAQAGQPGRGGDGAGLPGLPGGKGGQSGAAGGGGASSANYEAAFFAYCADVLKQARPGASSKKPVQSDDYEAEDCIDYFASLETGQSGAGAGGKGGTAGRDGTAGQSIAGGQGGKGGKSGSGSGGGSGGGGGAGIAGGKGGKGGAGGATD